MNLRTRFPRICTWWFRRIATDGPVTATCDLDAFRRRPRPVDPAPEYSRLDMLDGLTTRYDAQWPDVLAAEAGGWAGGDLAAMAAPWPGMARDDLGTYAEPAVLERGHHGSVAGCPLCEPAKPRGRHRQTDAVDLILADLRDLDGLS